MFIRAYRNTKENKIEFLRVDFDGPWMVTETNKPATISDYETIRSYSDLEFLDYKTGKVIR